jgi:LmbE family N-acetylglucosaminyl deacetylase
MNTSNSAVPNHARRLPDGRVVRGTLSDVFPDWTDAERWLFVSPHDDDPAVAGGLLLALAKEAGVSVRVRIATDGSMGYTPKVTAEDVIERRREETLQSFLRFGVDDVAWWSYPDTQLYRWQGRFPTVSQDNGAVPDRPFEGHAVDGGRDYPTCHSVAGYTGLQNSIVAELRSYRPTRIFLLSSNDYHPDHKVVHQETMISLFHAQGDIWPELGDPIVGRPWVHELAAYCPFVSPPDIRLRGSDALFRVKLDAITDFASQTQIETLVAAIRNAGPVEYVRSYRFETYDPSAYASLFDGDE